MDEKKQIEEMANYIDRSHWKIEQDFTGCHINSSEIAEYLYNHSYRKQSVGEWIGKTDYAGYGYYCSNCNAVFTGVNAEWIAKEHKYCPKCGAKMKGGDR